MAQTQDLAPTRLADQLERGFRGGAWHGPAVMEVLSGVDAAMARWHSDAISYTIAEIVGHLTYWLKDARRQILGEPAPQGEAGADWAHPRPESEAAWHAACADLERAQGLLLAEVLQLTENRLDEARPGSDTTIRGLLIGTLQHNAYHSGQIALLRKLAQAAAGKLP
jgi:uncharacterized damage-inducible protein DinB